MASAGEIFYKGFVFFLIGLLILAFALWGIGDVLRGGGRNEVAKVGELEISNAMFQVGINQQARRFQQAYGQALPDEMLPFLQQQTMNTLVNQYLILNKLSEMGVEVSREVVLDTLKERPDFYTADGSFNRLAFEQLLSGLGMNEAIFLEIARQEKAINFLMESLTRRVPVTNAQLDAMHRYEAEQRAVELMEVTGDSITQTPEPTEVQLIEYYENAKSQFDAPEYRSVDYVTFGVAQVADEIDTGEERLKTLYEERKAAFTAPEKREVSHVIFASEQEATDALTELKKGKTFEEMAQARLGQKPASLGDVTRATLLQSGLLNEEVADKVFALEKAGVSEPVQSPLGWHLFRVENIVAAELKTFDAIKKQLKEQVLAEEGEPILYDLSTKINDRVAAGESLAGVAKEFKLTVQKAEGIDAQGMTRGGDTPAAVPVFGDFLGTVFALPQGQVSDAVGDDGGLDYYVAQVTQVEPGRARALDEVRGKVVAAWKRQKKEELLSERSIAIAGEINASLKGSKDPLSVFKEKAASLGLKTESKKPFTRLDAQNMGLPAGLIEEAYKVKKGGVTQSHSMEDRYAIALVTEVIPAEQNKNVTKAMLRPSLEESVASDLIAQYLAALRKKYEVSVFFRPAGNQVQE